MLNNVAIIGRITKNLELRKTETGKAVTSFSIAVARDYDDQVDFFDITAWNKLAENLVKYCQKGSLIGVTGTMRTNFYTNKEGIKINTVYVLADRIDFLLHPKKENTTNEEDVNLENVEDPIDF